MHGTALYVGALVGPGLLLVPALAAQQAGAASIVAWIGLLLVSAPLAVTFGALGVRHPVAGGVSTYVREGLGDDAAAVTGGWFLTAIVIGAPAAALIGGYYVAALTGSGTTVATIVGFVIYTAVLGANLLGLRVSAAFQLGLMSVLVVVIAIAIAVALPSHGGDNWQPFAPHGWWAVGTAANILMWLFFGWEAVAQLAGDFRRPERDLPRAIALAYAIVAVLYLALAVATIGVTAGTSSRVPLADLISVGFGRAGRDATAVLAVALTMGTINVYLGGAAKLAAALAGEGSLPAWFAEGTERTVPRRPLTAISAVVFVGLAALAAGIGSTEDLVRATSALFIAVYVLALLSAVRILDGLMRATAVAALAATVVLSVFSEQFLLVPVVAAVAALALTRGLGQRRAVRPLELR
ncbi:MAG TPA: amino acid permease [Gaiellaceae bacterium]|nr:amino acid permease [Gaiellaceae bacterium]